MHEDIILNSNISMNNGNENEAEIKSRPLRYDINRPGSRHGHKYTKYKLCVSV